jgi:signal transduction histidine kinase
MSWTHRALWCALSCTTLPELNWGLSSMIAELGKSLPKETPPTQAALHLLRFLAVLTLQGLAVTPLAAADGVLSTGTADMAACAIDVLMLLLLPDAICETQALVTLELGEYQRSEIQKSQKYSNIKQLMLSLERKNRFLSVMMHELRTPLHCIIAMAHAVHAQSNEEPLLSDNVAHIVLTIELSGRRLLQLINDLLDAAHLRSAPLLVRCALLVSHCETLWLVRKCTGLR